MGKETGIVSPCTGLCLIDSRRNLCTGCYRTLEEIARWSGFSDYEKREILKHLPERREAFLEGEEEAF